VELPVAEVAVFEIGAIGINVARAGDCFPVTFSNHTVISKRARVGIVALAIRGRVLAAARRSAQILGADVSIVAVDCVAHTDPCITVISRGARVSVHAFPPVKSNGLAAAVA